MFNQPKAILTDMIIHYLQRVLNDGVSDAIEDENVENVGGVFDETLDIASYGNAISSKVVGVRLRTLKSYSAFRGEPKNIIIAIFEPVVQLPNENIRYSVCIRKDNLVTISKIRLPLNVQ